MRIFIDCSLINFAAQPTGIPRVVARYVEEGYAWAARTGIEVVPVLTTAAGLLPVLPLPGRNPPEYLRRQVRDRAFDPAFAARQKHHVDSAAFHFQAALQELGAPPMPEECNEAARHAMHRLITQFGESEMANAIAPVPGDVLFCPAYWHDVPPANFRQLADAGVKVVTLVHDILPVTHGKFYQAPWKYQFEAALVEAIRHSAMLFAVSRFTADSIVEFAARKGLGAVSVEVAHNGYEPLAAGAVGEAIASGAFSPLVRRGKLTGLLRDRNPFIMVGTLEPKKGHIPAIRSFEKLWDAGLDRPLVVIGRKGWMERPVVEAVEKSPYYKDRLFWFDNLDDVDLALAYRHARGLIFASYAEGFGIPMVEALANNCPLVVLDMPVAREVAGEHGLFFADFSEFASHVVRLDGDEGFAAARAAITGFAWPGWPEIAGQVFDRLAASAP